MDRRHELVKEALDEWPDSSGLKLLEIGIRHGETYKALREYLSRRSIHYTGVDVEFYMTPPSDLNANWLKMDSGEFWKRLPLSEMFHVIFVDGCHGDIHAELDTKGGLLHLRIGGTLLLHDTGLGDELRHPITENGGCFGAFCRNCLNRPELKAWIDRSHPEGMGIVKKLAEVAARFLVETETVSIRSCCDICTIYNGIPPVREAFPLYFGGEHVAET